MEFPKFQCLPLELQLKIWLCSFPRPRVVDVVAVSVSKSLQPHFKSASTANTPSTESSDGTSLESKSVSWTPTVIERVYSPPRSLSHLHICAQARSLALGYYSRMNADLDLKGPLQFHYLQPNTPTFEHTNRSRPKERETRYCIAQLEAPHRPYALLDPRCDLIFLQDPPLTRHKAESFIESSLQIFVRWIGASMRDNLRSLAIPYYTWRKSRETGTLRLLVELKALESLYVSYLGGSESGSASGNGAGGRSWVDAVGGLWAHIQEIEDEVVHDLEGLKREFSTWKKPAVKVVKHRAELVNGLS
jgi:hypothetical protein